MRKWKGKGWQNLKQQFPGCAGELELSLRRNRGPGINNRAEAFPLGPGICSSLLANLFERLLPLCGLQSGPKGKEILRMPFVLFVVYEGEIKQQQGGWGKPLC